MAPVGSSLQSITETLAKRHGGHHHANVKYGYMIFAASIFYTVLLFLVNFLYVRIHLTANRLSISARKKRFVKKLNELPLYAQVLIWSVIILGISFIKFEKSNYIGLIKRFGRLSYALIPFNIFLTLKPSPLPKLNYLNLTNLHKWISRLIIFFSIAHGVGYFVKWSMEKLFIAKNFKFLNFLGFITFILFSLVLTISLKPIRSRFYDLFYIFHYLVAWITLILISFHARPGVNIYSAIAIILLLYQSLHKYFMSNLITNTSNEITIKKNEKSNLILVYINNSVLNWQWIPGSHIRFANSFKKNPFNLFAPSHPYTISSNKEIVLIIKKTKFEIDLNKNYSLLGPYSSIHDSFFNKVKQSVIVCGGSGISFGLPIYQYLLQKNKYDLLHTKGFNIKFIWVIRNKNDIYVLKELGLLKQNKKFNVNIYITGQNSSFGNNEDNFNKNIIHSNNNDINNISSPKKQSFLKMSMRGIQTIRTIASSINYNSYKKLSDSHRIDEGDLEEIDLDEFNIEDELLKGSKNNNKKRGKWKSENENVPLFSLSTPEDIESQSGISSPINGNFGFSEDENEDEDDDNFHKYENQPIDEKPIKVHYGRPNLNVCLGQLLDDPESPSSSNDANIISDIEYNGKWIISCGPKSLNSDFKQWAKRHDIGFVSEQYSM
ncbi:putative metalloreductase ASCRUDRAFT_73639 [Ascoidea rubescens DSM 1968]|uniref:Probable metalloreductase AIM14 n=1 Tax=Ascoidea rubescens DSM 1968 TaxID=1344418 RepID=A0A1D2VQK9_9ASCO|nr:hypothetical protein ASCRUDRAFT_73639 [Ascoidea rubescens DSM 1968]ODV63891.1 hypothetical protein ASCRUDRAFT_73639 [Ascoidea rubescens DSM 1968]